MRLITVIFYVLQAFNLSAVVEVPDTLINKIAHHLKVSSENISQSWRMLGTIKLSSNESYNLIGRNWGIKNYSQDLFDKNMALLASGQPTIFNNILAKIFGELAVEFSAHKYNNNWQIWVHFKDSIDVISSSIPMPVKPLSIPTVPVIDSNDVWINKVSNIAKPYYLKAYEDDPYDVETRTIKGVKYKVNRPDHALAHALRKFALSLDLLSLVRSGDKTNQLYNVVQALSKDIKNFDQLMGLAAALLRAGRQSEDLNNIHYKEYCYNSAAIFKQEAYKLSNFNKPDIEDVVLAMQAIGDDSLTLSGKQTWLKNLLYAIHHLDLLRIPSFGGGKKLDVNMLRKSVATFLSSNDNKLIDGLFALSAKYLDVTGDRNIPANRYDRLDQFFLQANEPKLIIQAIKSVGGFK